MAIHFINKYHAQFTPKQRFATITISVLLSLYAFYTLCLSPLNQQINNKIIELQRKQAIITHYPLIHNQKTILRTYTQWSLLKRVEYINKTLERNKASIIYNTTITPQQTIKVHISAIVYADFIQWLWQLTHTIPLKLHKLSIKRQQQSNWIVVDLVIT